MQNKQHKRTVHYGIKHQFEWEELVWKFLSEFIILKLYLKIKGSIIDRKLDIKIAKKI